MRPRAAGTVQPGRRRALGLLGAGLAAVALPSLACAGTAKRRLSLVNAHTGESLELVYWRNGYYLADALKRVNWLLRDFRAGVVWPMDRALLDGLARLAADVDTSEPFRVISGYRSPATNAALRARSSGVARRSLHMRGKAVDITTPDVTVADLREAAVAMRLGGVGYYPHSGFIHVDTGRVRYW